jgi:hypothetical protein
VLFQIPDSKTNHPHRSFYRGTKDAGRGIDPINDVNIVIWALTNDGTSKSPRTPWFPSDMAPSYMQSFQAPPVGILWRSNAAWTASSDDTSSP